MHKMAKIVDFSSRDYVRISFFKNYFSK